MSTREREPEAEEGSWVTSGTDSQKITRRLEEELKVTAIHTFVASAMALAARGVEVFVMGAEGSCENAAWPE